MDAEKAEVLVIGGGVAGLSTALHLARKGQKGIVVLEREPGPGGHASGRNAGMIQQAVSDPVLAALARESRDALQAAGKKWKSLGFRANGSLLLATGDGLSELEKIQKNLKATGVRSEKLTPRKAAEKVSPLKGGAFDGGLFSPTDAVVEVRPLLNGFLKELKKKNVRVLYGHRLEKVKRSSEGFRVETEKGAFLAKKMVNAAGAWAETVAKKAGAQNIPFLAYRRHLFTGSLKGSRKNWPFVWDISHHFYFRPEKGGLLLSPCDHEPFRLGNARGERTDPAKRRDLLKKLDAFSTNWKGLRLSNPVAGLRTMSPDGRFVIGADKKLKNFYWVAGLGGHGVTTCFAVGRLAAEAILGQNRGNQTAKALSPGRF